MPVNHDNYKTSQVCALILFCLCAISFSDTTKGEPFVVSSITHPYNVRFSSYLGGTNSDACLNMAVDKDGFIYLTGWTRSKDFKTTDAFQRKNAGNEDAFVTKIDPIRKAIVYSTYLGGRDIDEGHSIAVDSLGNAYVVGFTASDNFPVMNSTLTSLKGPADAFIAKLDTSGTLIYSALVGGHNADIGNSIAYHSGKLYITGNTLSSDFPLKNAFQKRFFGDDGFVAVFDSKALNLLYSSYIGGSDHENSSAIAVDGKGEVYIAGSTQSKNFHIHNAYSSHLTGPRDAYVLKFSPLLKKLIFGTFFGGTLLEDDVSLAVDDLGNSYLAGWSNSTAGFPIINAFQPVRGDPSNDSFVAKFSPKGKVLYSSFIGGSGADFVTSITVRNRKAFLCGWTNSTDFPVKNSIQPFNRGKPIFGEDAFLLKLSRNGQVLFATYFGGGFGDKGRSVVTDAKGNIFIAGETDSIDFPVKNAVQPHHSDLGNDDDLFVTQFSPSK